MKAEIKSKFVAALRSGNYAQTSQALHVRDNEGSDRFCALGVLCDLARQDGIVEVSGEDRHHYRGTLLQYSGHEASLPDEVQAWAEVDDAIPLILDAGGNRLLEEVPFDWDEETDGEFCPAEVDIAYANDTGWSFEKIADALEAGDAR